MAYGYIHTLYHALKQGIENRNTVANAPSSFEVERKFFRSRWLFKKNAGEKVRGRTLVISNFIALPNLRRQYICLQAYRAYIASWAQSRSYF
jgi:hypothetical protein